MPTVANTGYTLVQVRAGTDWEIYHRIRREELFEAKGRTGYDPNRPEEHEPSNCPLLLKWNGVGIATTRLDIRGGTAVVRLVAVTHAHQGEGHGRVLAEHVEKFARAKGVRKFVLNAEPKAVGYYDRLGYVREDWDPQELTGISEHAIQMSKMLL